MGKVESRSDVSDVSILVSVVLHIAGSSYYTSFPCVPDTTSASMAEAQRVTTLWCMPTPAEDVSVLCVLTQIVGLGFAACLFFIKH